MKKYNLLKVIGITFLIVVALSWIIPVGVFNNGAFQVGQTEPLGLMDLIRLPLSTFANLIQYAITFVLIGGLYGVLNKTGAYDNLVEKVVEKYKGKEQLFLIITMLIFICFTSLTGLTYVAFVVVPFFIAILLSMNYDKKTALMATIGSIFVGVVGCTYGFNINGVINYYFALNVHSELITKIIFLALVSFLSILFVVKTSKRVNYEKAEKIDIPLFKKDKNDKKSYWPLVIIMLIALVIAFVGMYNWLYSFNISFFNEAHDVIMDVKINDYPIVSNLIGSINPMGNWSIYELAVVLVVAMILIGWIYSMKVKEFIDGFISGAKEMLPTACYVTLANIVFMVMLSGYNGQNMFYTIANYFFELTKDLNIATMSVVSALGSFFYNDFTNFFNAMGTNIAIIYPDAELYPVIAFVVRVMYGLVSFITPTSLFLIAGLSYLNISYKEWLKYIWKLLLQIFVIALVIIIIMLLFI